MGEEWVQTGQHFIPLKSGGQINLKADSYPIINLSNGNKIIVDLYNNLPDKVAKLVTSNWENYRIVHLGEDDDLIGALGKILLLCEYQEIYSSGEPLELGGDIPLRITADWIIKPAAGQPDEKGKMIMITFTDQLNPKTPQKIKDFLAGLDIIALDYPPGEESSDESADRVEMVESNSISELVEILLNLTGRHFSNNVEIPIYQSQKTDFNLIIKADFLFNIDGKDHIIDYTGLGPDTLSLLREHQFLALSLTGEKDPALIVSKILDFIGVKYDSKPHHFMAADREDSKNIRITIPGIIFQDHNGQTILATHLRLPREIANFLSQKGYKILSLTLS